jgi:hypothetical protein
MKLKPFNEVGTQVANFSAVGAYALHGDVVIERVAALPANFASLPAEPQKALAYGEATGHIHQLQGGSNAFDLRYNPETNERFLRVVEPVTLKHQEHSPIVLPPGDYVSRQQVEYDPFEKLTRRVID